MGLFPSLYQSTIGRYGVGAAGGSPPRAWQTSKARMTSEAGVNYSWGPFSGPATLVFAEWRGITSISQNERVKLFITDYKPASNVVEPFGVPVVGLGTEEKLTGSDLAPPPYAFAMKAGVGDVIQNAVTTVEKYFLMFPIFLSRFFVVYIPRQGAGASLTSTAHTLLLQFVDGVALPGGAWGVPGPGFGGGGGGGDGDWDQGDTDAAVGGARNFMKDTGRTCGDFFKTLRSGPSADKYLAGRASLLTKVKSGTAGAALQRSNTICARIAQPQARGPRISPTGATVPEGRVWLYASGVTGQRAPLAMWTPDYDAALARAQDIIKAYQRAGLRGWQVKIETAPNQAALLDLRG